MGLRVALAIAVVATSLLRGSAAVAAERGIVVELPSLGGGTGFAFANGINARGQVVGVSATASGFHAVLWEDGVAHDLGTLVRPDPPFTYSFSDARAINEEGVAVGYSFAFGAVNQPTRAVRFDRDGVHDLGTLGGGGSSANGINNRGTIVGGAQTSTGASHAFALAGGAMRDLGTLGGNTSAALAVNDADEIVGVSETATGDLHGFLYSRGGMRDLGTLGGSTASALAIDARGEVTGQSQTAGGQNHAFLFDRAGLHDLGTLGGGTSAGRAISERGTVVGSADLPDGSMQAFTLSHGTLAALPLLPDGRHWFAAAVNDRGQVAGSTVADQPHAVLFAP